METSIFSTILDIDNQMQQLKKMREDAVKNIILNNAKYKVGDVINKKRVINCKTYNGLVIRDVKVVGGYYTNRYGDTTFHEYRISYTVEPRGSFDTYTFYEDEL